MRYFNSVVLLTMFCLSLMQPTAFAAAAEASAKDIVIERAWARATAGRAANGAAYVTLQSQGGADRLVGVSSNAAKRVELHTHIKDGDIMRMRHIEAIPVDAGATVEMRPGGLHIMLMGLHAPLKEGATLVLNLTFEKSGDVEVQAEILAPGSRGPVGHKSDGNGHMGGMKQGR